MELFVLFRMLTAFVQMNTTSFWFGVAWDLYPVEHEGTRALKIEVVVNLALWWQLIAPTIAHLVPGARPRLAVAPDAQPVPRLGERNHAAANASGDRDPVLSTIHQQIP